MYVINNNNYYNKIYAPDTKHKMKIKLDNHEIDSKYLRNLTLKDEAFSNDYFSLGGVTLCEIELEINKEAFADITFDEGSVFYFEEVVTVDEEDINIPIGYFYVHLDLVDTENEYTNKFILYDRLYDLMDKNIDFSEQVKDGTFTRLDLVKLICENYGIELGSESFLNSDKVVGTYDNQLSIITWLGFVSERAGGFAKIGRDGKLYIKSYGDVDEITISTTAKGEIEKGDIKTISGVTYQNATQSFTAGNNDGLIVYLSQDNYFSCSQDEVGTIYESLNGLQFQSLKVRIWGDSSIDTGDIIKIGDYITFCQKDWEYGQGFYGYYDTQLSEVKSSLEVKKLNNNQKLRRAYTLIDEVNGKIDLAVEDIGDRTSKNTSITQDLDSISERVSLQQNLTNIVKKTSYVDTEDAYEGNLLYLSIHGQMSLLYPSDDLYPEDTLYPLDSYLIIEYSDNTQNKIRLPINWLNYFDINTYDEFILEENKAKIIRRVGENEDGSFYKLENEVVEDYGDLIIPVKTGYNKLWLESFYDLELNYEIRYVIKSDYTDTFATEYYVDNSIEVNNKGIILEAKSYTDKETQGDALIAKINLDSTGNAKIDASKTIDLNGVDINLTSDNITINSTNFNVDKSGKVTATAGEIGGFNLTSTNFSNEIDGDYDYSYGDLLACQACILDGNEEDFGDAMGSKAFTSYYKNILDTSGDGILNALDLLQIQKCIFEMYELHKNAKGKLVINSNNPKNCFSILDGNGDYSFQAGTTGATIREINAETIICASPDTYKDGKLIILKGYDGSIMCKTLNSTVVNQTSLQSQKKNFEKYSGALEEINNIDIYKYNLKSEEDTTKKHLGFVIGDDFNYSKVITNDGNTGVDIYSMTSLCLQAIKEQQKEIEELRKEINSLKEEK